MGLFDIFKKKKEYDLEKDNLNIEFNLGKMEYVVYKDGNIIPYEELNEKTKQYYNNLKNEYNQKIRNRYLEMTNELGLSLDSFDVGYVDEIKMTSEMENILMPIINEPNVVLAIHRTFAKEKDGIEDIVNNGIIMTGDLVSPELRKDALKRNFSFYPDNQKILKEIIVARKYQNGISGSLLIRIPDEDFRNNADLYVTDSRGKQRINPKYVVGYFPSNENGIIDSVVKPNPKYSYKYNNGDQMNLADDYSNTMNKAM